MGKWHRSDFLEPLSSSGTRHPGQIPMTRTLSGRPIFPTEIPTNHDQKPDPAGIEFPAAIRQPPNMPGAIIRRGSGSWNTESPSPVAAYRLPPLAARLEAFATKPIDNKPRLPGSRAAGRRDRRRRPLRRPTAVRPPGRKSSSERRRRRVPEGYGNIAAARRDQDRVVWIADVESGER